MRHIKTHEINEQIFAAQDRIPWQERSAFSLAVDRGFLDLARSIKADYASPCEDYDCYDFFDEAANMLFSLPYTVKDFDGLGIRLIHNGVVTKLIIGEDLVYNWEPTTITRRVRMGATRANLTPGEIEQIQSINNEYAAQNEAYYDANVGHLVRGPLHTATRANTTLSGRWTPMPLMSVPLPTEEQAQLDTFTHEGLTEPLWSLTNPYTFPAAPITITNYDAVAARLSRLTERLLQEQQQADAQEAEYQVALEEAAALARL